MDDSQRDKAAILRVPLITRPILPSLSAAVAPLGWGFLAHECAALGSLVGHAHNKAVLCHVFNASFHFLFSPVLGAGNVCT